MEGITPMKVDGISQYAINRIEKGQYTGQELQEWIDFANEKMAMWERFRDLCYETEAK